MWWPMSCDERTVRAVAVDIVGHTNGHIGNALRNASVDEQDNDSAQTV